jgi:hypothetical protein
VIVATHTVELELVLECRTASDLDACRRELARRLAGQIPFARIHAGEREARVVRAEIRSPGLPGPILLAPRPRGGDPFAPEHAGEPGARKG